MWFEAARPAVRDADQLRRAGWTLNLYAVSLDNCWVVFVPKPVGLFSTQFIALSKDTARSVYAGSANDEG